MRIVVTPAGESQPSAASPETDTVVDEAPTPPPPSALTVSPTALDFGSVRLGRTATKRITLKNTGGTTVVLGGVARTGAASSDFTPVGSCLFAELKPGRSCTIDVVFKPHELGDRTAQLRLFDDQGDGPPPIALTGTGKPKASKPGKPKSKHGGKRHRRHRR